MAQHIKPKSAWALLFFRASQAHCRFISGLLSHLSECNKYGYVAKVIAPDGATTTYTFAPAVMKKSSRTDANGNVPPSLAILVEGLVGALTANFHTDLDVDELDFFHDTIFGTDGFVPIVEEHPFAGQHVAQVATVPEPGTFVLLGWD